MGGIGIGSDGLFHEIKEKAVSRVGLSAAELEALYGRMPELIKKIRDIL